MKTITKRMRWAFEMGINYVVIGSMLTSVKLGTIAADEFSNVVSKVNKRISELSIFYKALFGQKLEKMLEHDTKDDIIEFLTNLMTNIDERVKLECDSCERSSFEIAKFLGLCQSVILLSDMLELVRKDSYKLVDHLTTLNMDKKEADDLAEKSTSADAEVRGIAYEKIAKMFLTNQGTVSGSPQSPRIRYFLLMVSLGTIVSSVSLNMVPDILQQIFGPFEFALLTGFLLVIGIPLLIISIRLQITVSSK